MVLLVLAGLSSVARRARPQDSRIAHLSDGRDMSGEGGIPSARGCVARRKRA